MKTLISCVLSLFLVVSAAHAKGGGGGADGGGGGASGASGGAGGGGGSTGGATGGGDASPGGGTPSGAEGSPGQGTSQMMLLNRCGAILANPASFKTSDVTICRRIESLGR